MKKRLFTYAIALVVMGGLRAQTVRLDGGAKSDAGTRVKIMKQKQSKGDEELSFLAKVTDGFDAGRLREKGIKVGSQAGDIVTLRLRADETALLDEDNTILIYSIARPIQPLLDAARYDTHTDSVHEGIGLPQAYTGEGVIIGITDWGFDYTHPNYNNNGADNRRILRAWDQFRVGGPAPAGFDYGTEHNGRVALINAKCDTFGLYGYGTHGTHVAGIAAGRGIEGRYQGQAPDANLLMASFYLNEAAWVDAANWMKEVALQEGKRLVVNCSWGMYTLGPIDGTSLASQALNNLADSGVVFCVSAGNNGDDKFHVSRTFVAGEPDTLKTFAEYYNYREIGSGLTMWGESGKAFKATIAFGNDTTAIPYRWLNTDEGDAYIEDFVVALDDTVWFDATIERANPSNNRPSILINIQKNSRLTTHLMITAEEGTVHAWNLCNLANGAGNMGAEFTKRNNPSYQRGDDEYSVGEPACAEKCIAVAAHRSDKKKPSGVVEPGSLASFSSHGPIIDGRHKPDVSAPGVDVISSINHYTTDFYDAVMTYTYASRSYIWARMSGTSMSAPSVTGISALVLQANPDLTAEEVKEILMATARNDEKTGPLHEHDSISNVWGWGKVDALAAVNEALSRVDIKDVDEEWLTKSLQVFPNPAHASITIYTGRHTAEEVSIYSIEGRKLLRQQIAGEAQIDISRLTKGVYLVKCGGRTAKVVVR